MGASRDPASSDSTLSLGPLNGRRWLSAEFANEKMSYRS
jgi:hypothetical protein